jgi:hypothetical protein
MFKPLSISRREWLGTALAATALLGPSSIATEAIAKEAAQLPKAKRPKPPYRVWFQPRQFERDMDLYRNMTIDASGWLDPRLAELAGKTALAWVYGLQHPYATGSEYWRDACSERARLYPQQDSKLIGAGIAIDEWVPPKLPMNEPWLAEGLRAGRKENPDVFIALWTTDPTKTLLELGHDGTLDLIIVEGYTHSVRPELSTSWEGALRRCDQFAEADLMDKTIFSFGHITDRPNNRGERLKPAWLAKHADELKKRYPAMPGVAFFQSEDPDTPELRELVRFCDRISGELWPGERK